MTNVSSERSREKMTRQEIWETLDAEKIASEKIKNVTKITIPDRDEIAGYVFESKDYDKFKLSRKLNRKVISAHIKNMQKSFKEADLGEDFPILVDKEFRVIDGQHRFVTRKGLGFPIFYKISKRTYTAKELFLINKYVQKWTNEAFLEKLAQEGNKSAIKAISDAEKYNTPLNIYLACVGISISDELIISGKFTYTENHSEKAYELFFELEIFKNYPFWNQHRFIKAYMAVRKLNNFKYKMMAEQIKKYPELIGERGLPRSKMLFKLIEVYNFNRRKDHRIPYPHQDVFDGWGDA